MELGFFQKDLLIEELAKKFYAIQGYHVKRNYRMQAATHPQEVNCVAMAFIAVKEIERILRDKDFVHEDFDETEIDIDQFE
jgi:hypothetical protein